MKRIYPITASLLLLLVVLAQAHEFWLQPGTFFAEPGQVVPINVLVGEYFNGERSEGKKNRLVQYAHWSGGAKTDLSPTLTDGHYGVMPLKIARPGTHLIALANTTKYLEMRADSFLLYLQEDGLDHIIDLRQQRGESGTRSRELYRRCVKTLIQAGPVQVTDQTFATDTGMPLEIIPLQNPYSLKTGDQADFQILFNHKPLANALVRYWNRPVNGSIEKPGIRPAGLTETHQRSSPLGRVRFRLKTGQNMVSLVQMVPNEDRQQADWQSYWGSFTFGCR